MKKAIADIALSFLTESISCFQSRLTYIYHSKLHQSPTDGCLGCSQTLAVTNNARIHGTCIFSYMYMYILEIKHLQGRFYEWDFWLKV